jgi:type IV secretion system protein VirB8
MSPEAREQADAYYEGARSWTKDHSDDLRGSRRIAWIVALVAVAAVTIQALVILWLLPLKTVIPYTLLVDRQTGYVQALDPLDAKSISPDRALTQSFLVQYVLAREGFDRSTIQQAYRKALLWSAEGARNDYAALMPVTNPQSPLSRMPQGSIIDAQVRSVTALGERSVLVRFDTIQRDRGGAAQPAQPWVAVIDFRFSTAPLSAEDRFINPLGFQVTRYRRSAEALPVEAPKATPNASALPRDPGQPQSPVASRADAAALPNANGAR